MNFIESCPYHRKEDKIKKNQYAYMLDGFDEIAPENRCLIRDWIEDLRIILKDCPIIVTSRPLTTDQLDKLPSEWIKWNIMPFDPPRIIDYISRWYAKVPLLVDGGENVAPEHLAEQWSNDPTIGPLTSNPLLLSTLLMVHHLDGSLPNGRAQLYRRYVDGMLGLWDDRRKVAATGLTLTLIEKKLILTSLAIHFQLSQQEQIDESEALQVTLDALSSLHKKFDAVEVLSTLRERSGLIVGPGVYSFIHKSVSEFLVAEAAMQGNISDNSGKRLDRFQLFEHRGDDRWNVVTFLWAGLAPVAEVETFIEQCIEVNDIALGYGVFYDQITRFTPKFKRQIILRLLKSKPDLQEGNHYWAAYMPGMQEPEHELMIPSAQLRGLTHTLLPSVLFAAAGDGTLIWSDGKDLDIMLNKLVWMSIVCGSNNVEDWGECIKDIPESLDNRESWILWLADTAIRKGIADKSVTDESNYIKEFNAYYSQYYAFLVFVTLSRLIEYDREIDRRFGYSHDFTDTIKKLLYNLKFEGIPTHLLSLTRYWRLNLRESTFDLLQVSLPILESLPQDTGTTPDTGNIVIERIKLLITQRREEAEQKDARERESAP